MGKGGGCMPSKKRHPSAATTAVPPPSPPSPPPDPKIYIVFYSMYGHVERLARAMKSGIDGARGVEAVLRRVPETLPPEVLDQMRAPPKGDDIPVIGEAAELAAADGVLFGFPTRFGCMAAQMKGFFDSMGAVWREQRLAGKPAGVFVSTGTQGGGQETTALKCIMGALETAKGELELGSCF